MRAFEFITGHVIYKPVYTYKFQLKTTRDRKNLFTMTSGGFVVVVRAWEVKCNEKLCFLQAIYLQCRAYLVTISKTIS